MHLKTILKGSIIVTGGTQNGTTLSNVLAIKYVPEAVQPIIYSELENLPIPLRHHCSTVYMNQLFVLGGYTESGFPRNASYGLINGREWKPLPNMIYARYVF